MHEPHAPAVDEAGEGDGRNPAASANKSPLKFFGLVLVLSIPFWVLGALSQIELLPSLPVSALMIVAPVTAALILVYRESRSAGVKALLKRSFDFRRVKFKILYVPTIFLVPGIMLTALSAGLFGFQVGHPSQNIGHRIDDSFWYLADDFSSVFPFPRLRCHNLRKLSAWIYCGIGTYLVASNYGRPGAQTGFNGGRLMASIGSADRRPIK